MSPISAYDQEVGHPPKIIMWFQDWLYPYPQPAVANVLASGAAAELTWEPWDSSNGSANQPTYKLTNITRGDFDTYIHQFAHDAAASHQRLYLRFAHEMDGYWYPWGTAPGNQYTPPNPLGNTPQDYVNAWRHVHDIFVQEGATNVAWVWAPNLDYTGGAPFAQDYPGDAYVDYLGLSGYNRGTTQQWFTWESFDQLYSSSYAMLTAITSKPIIISEIASVEQGGDKAQWITQGFLTTIPQSYPQIRGIVWDDSPPGSQWTVDSSPAALAAWQEVAAAPYYQGTLP
jgi:beta-mannanase